MAPRDQFEPALLAIASLGVVMLIIMFQRAQNRQAIGELELARRDRSHFENEVEELKRQRDGLLDHMNETKRQDGDDEPEPAAG